MSQYIAQTAVAARKAALAGTSVIDGWKAYEPTLPPMNIHERDKLLEAFKEAHRIVLSRPVCIICGRPHVDGMTLNSGPVDKSLCYQRETGADPLCTFPKTPPQCPHGKGLNCRTCYPIQY